MNGTAVGKVVAMVVRVGVTGHQRIPQAARDYVERGLGEFLRQYRGMGGDVVGLSALAWGADQLFAAAMLREGHRLEAIVPCARYAGTFDERGLAEYQALLAQASSVVELGYPEPSEDAYLAAGMRVVDDCDILVALWDGLPAAGKGGTGDAVAYARSQERPVVIIWPAGVLH